MGNYQYKCSRCRRDKKGCELLIHANTITGCQRCHYLRRQCDEFSFKEDLDDSRQANVTMSNSFPVLGYSARSPLPSYGQLNLGSRDNSTRYDHDRSANSSTLSPLRRLRQLFRIRRNYAAAPEDEATDVALSILDHAAEQAGQYGSLCWDALREARKHHAPLMTGEYRNRYRSKFQATFTDRESMERAIGYISEQLSSQDDTAFSIDRWRSLNALTEVQTPGDVIVQAETAYAIMLSKTINILLPSGNDDSHGQYCAALLAGRFRWFNALQQLINSESGLSHCCVDPIGRNIIHILVDTGQREELAELLLRCRGIKRQARNLANSADYQSLTALDICAYKDEVGMFKTLLEPGAGISHLDSQGRRILDLAVSARSAVIVEACLEDPNIRDNMKQGMHSPLMAAVKLGNRPIVRMLLESGANPSWSRIPMSQFARDQKMKELMERYENEWAQQGLIPPSTGEQVSSLFHRRVQEPTQSNEEHLQSSEVAETEPSSPLFGEESERASSKPPSIHPPEPTWINGAPHAPPTAV